MASPRDEELVKDVKGILAKAAQALSSLGEKEGREGDDSDDEDRPSRGPELSLATLASDPSRFTSDASSDPLRLFTSEGFDDGPSERRNSHEEVLQSIDGWVRNALEYLNHQQRDEVLSGVELSSARNPNAVMSTRIKKAASLDQRVRMFIGINGLADAVADRMTTLTADQKEAVLATSLFIQGASNPSGVAMKRINDVLRQWREQGWSETKAVVPRSGGPVVARRPLVNLRPASARNDSRSRSRSLRGRRRGAKGSDSIVEPQRVPYSQVRRERAEEFVRRHNMEWWIAEVLQHMSLLQRQEVMKEGSEIIRARHPSTAFMARVKNVASHEDMVAMFVELNRLTYEVASELKALDKEQQEAVLAPGIYLQNARNPMGAVKSRIKQVLQGKAAVTRQRRERFSSD